MKSVVAGATVAVLAMASGVTAQTTINLEQQTWYGYPDNDSGGSSTGTSTTAYSCDGRGYVAGGSGSYDNPLTCAAPSGTELDQECAIIYYPYLQKYLVVQDQCATCHGNWIDVWIGDGDGGQTEVDCENNAPSGNGHNVILNAGPGQPTNTNALWSSDGGCQVAGNVYSDAS